MFNLQHVVLASLAIVVVSGNGGIQYKGNMKNPDDSNACYFTEHKFSIPINQTVYPTNLKESCIKVRCSDGFLLEIKHCRNIDPNNECKYTKANDYTKPFPDCCPVKTCPDNRELHEVDY